MVDDVATADFTIVYKDETVPVVKAKKSKRSIERIDFHWILESNDAGQLLDKEAFLVSND